MGGRDAPLAGCVSCLEKGQLVTLSTEDVWRAMDSAIFGVIACVNSQGEPRTAGVCYVIHDRSLLIATDKTAWKVRHIERDQRISMTVTVPNRPPVTRARRARVGEKSRQ